MYISTSNSIFFFIFTKTVMEPNKPYMNKHFQDVYSNIYNLSIKKIVGSTFVPVNLLHDVNKIKDNIVNRSLNALDEIEKNFNQENIILYADNIINKVNEFADYINTLDKEINNLESDKSVNEIIVFMSEHIIKLTKQEELLHQLLHPFKSELRILALEKLTNNSSILKELEADAKSRLKNISQKEIDASKALDNITDKVMHKGIEESAANFNQHRSHHSKIEKIWLYVFIVLSVLTAGAIGFVVFWKFDTQNNLNIISSIFQRILIISAPSIFLKISLSKYQLERNLRIIYDHRSTVLEQYKTFENAIGDDTEAKNKFRLEIAKYIFSDPNTGYISQSKNSEVSINPIINMAEKATKLDGS
ncbi:MAG: hypothetical protein GY774_16710 [Planctomycetes bacterium]|nr:hypothetical protein [Planctomycetota bacterium]